MEAIRRQKHEYLDEMARERTRETNEFMEVMRDENNEKKNEEKN